MATFGELLRRTREKANLTQAALADLAGVPLRTIQGWEQDYRCPVSPDFFKVTRALGVSADEFKAIAEDERLADRRSPTKTARKRSK